MPTASKKRHVNVNDDFQSLVSHVDKSHEQEIRQLDELLAPYYFIGSTTKLEQPQLAQNVFDTNDLLDFSILDSINDDASLSDMAQFLDMTVCQSTPFQSTFNQANTTSEQNYSILTAADQSEIATSPTCSRIEITKICEPKYSIDDDASFRDNHVTILKSNGLKIESNEKANAEDEENDNGELLEWERSGMTRRRRIINGAEKATVGFEAKLKPQTPIGKSMLSSRVKQKDGLKERGALLKNALIEESLNRSSVATTSSGAGSLFPCGYKDLVMNVLRKKKAA